MDDLLVRSITFLDHWENETPSRSSLPSPSISNYSRKVERSYQTFPRNPSKLFPFSFLHSFPFFSLFFLPLKDSPFVYIESNFPPFLSDDSHVSAICYTEREASRNIAIVATTLPHAKAITNAAWLHRWWCDGGRGGVRFSLNKVAAIFQTSGAFCYPGKSEAIYDLYAEGEGCFHQRLRLCGGRGKNRGIQES